MVLTDSLLWEFDVAAMSSGLVLAAGTSAGEPAARGLGGRRRAVSMVRGQGPGVRRGVDPASRRSDRPLPREGLDHEEVSCSHGLSVVGAPALAGRPGWSAASVAADGPCADDDAELEELAADPLGAAVLVVARHGGDELTDLAVQARSAQSAAGPPAPEQAPALAMPAQHGHRPDHEEVASPVPVEAADHQLEELVPSLEARPALGAEGHLELLAEEHVLEEEALAAESASEGGQQEAEELDHPRQDRRS